LPPRVRQTVKRQCTVDCKILDSQSPLIDTETQLAKRRLALLESNQPRNSQPETHSDAGPGAAFELFPALDPLGRDFPLPSKTHTIALTPTVDFGKETSNSSGGG